MVSVQGKWALVTGASRGIGAGIAVFLAQQGCNVILHSRDAAHCDQTLARVRALGVEARVVAAELGEPAQVEGMLAEIDALGVQVDFVFNDAGVQVAYRVDYLDTPVSDFTASFFINTIAPAMITYHFLPRMIARGFGRIINTTSGIRNEPQQAGYSASKAALDKFTTDLATTVDGTDVMLMLSDPGWCRTDLGGSKAPNSPESALPGMALGAFLEDRRSGRTIHAQDYTGLTLEQAVAKAQQ